VVHRIQRQAEWAIRGAGRSRMPIDQCRKSLIASVEHIADMTLIAVRNDESEITIPAVEALSELARGQLELKHTLPAAWFEVGSVAELDRDFVTLDPNTTNSIVQNRTWLEAKILRSYQMIFFRALNDAPELNHLIAINTQRIACAALRANDRAVLRLCLRFLNTFLSRSITVRDVRSAQNVLSEFRRLACEVLFDEGELELVVELADRLQYYARMSFEAGDTFVAETVARHLSEMIIRAHVTRAQNHDTLLDILLQVDREPSGLNGQDAALSGVRKAQVKLATHYLRCGDAEYARRIYDDMKHESWVRLRAIQIELAGLLDPEWWEITNSDENWDYLSDEQKKQLPVFFGWFQEEAQVEAPLKEARC
jgi:hypothetical protein